MRAITDTSFKKSAIEYQILTNLFSIIKSIDMDTNQQQSGLYGNSWSKKDKKWHKNYQIVAL